MADRCVLVIEDELGPRESLRIILGNAYRVRTVANGEQALWIAEQEPFDLITLDLKLPDIPGMNLLRTLKSMCPQTEFVVITGYGTYDSLVELYLIGVTVVFIKPFDISQLKEGIELALNRKKIHSLVGNFVKWLGNHWVKGSNNPISKTGLSCLKKKVATIERATGYFTEHGNNMWNLSRKFSSFMELDMREVYYLELSCYLHHLGLMGFCYPVSTRMIKANTAEELLIKSYPYQTVKLLDPLELDEELLKILLYCEEHHDGSGFPTGIRGDQVPIVSQILHLCNHVLFLYKNLDNTMEEHDIGNIIEHVNMRKNMSFSRQLVDTFLEIAHSNHLVHTGTKNS